MSLLTMSIIAVISAIILIIGLFIDEYKHENLKGASIIIGVVGLVAIGIFGFGLYATDSERIMVVKEIEQELIIIEV